MMKVKVFAFFTALCFMFMLSCAAWQKKTAHDKAADVLVSMASVVNVADSALKATIVQRAEQVKLSPQFAKALDGGFDFECWLSEKGEPISEPRRMSPGLSAGMCYYDMQLHPYVVATVAMKAFRDQLKVAAGIVDSATTPSSTVQVLVVRSLDGALGVLNAVQALGVQYPPAVTSGILALCSLIEATYPNAAVNCAMKSVEVSRGR
jgi:hypothetical protein